MDYKLQENQVFTAEVTADNVTQQSVDMDFTLPDYCADIEKILKCILNVRIFSKNSSAGVLRVDGESKVTLLYTDKGRKALRCFEQCSPFSVNLNIPEDAGDSIVDVVVKPEYINCRALTPRRLSVHGAFSLRSRLTERKLLPLYCDCDASDLQIKREETAVCEPCIFSQDRFSVSEAATFNMKTKVGTIADTHLSATLTDYSLSSDRLTIKGELTLRMLYITDASTGEVDRYVCAFPFTETLRVNNEECDVFHINLSIMSYDVTLRSEALSDNPAVCVEATLSADTFGFRRKSGEYIADAYSLSCATEPRFDKMGITTDVLSHTAEFSQKQTLMLGDRNIVKIAHILWSTPELRAEFESDVKLSGKVDVCILAVDEEGELLCIDRQVDISQVLVPESDFTHMAAMSADLSNLSYRIGDNNDIELGIKINISALLLRKNTISQISDIAPVAEETPFNRKPLTLYFASAGENVWEISKGYRASYNSVLEENNLSQQILSADTMLMIV